MWNQISLRVRIYTVLATLVLITLVGGLVMVWYTYRMEGLLTYLIDKNVAASQAAEALESSLAYQKGFVSYYYQDGDPDWLKALGEYRQVFRQRLEEARSFSEPEGQSRVIDRIEADYMAYIGSQDKVIQLYQKGQRETGSRLHKDVRDHYFQILDSCREYRDFYKERMPLFS